MAKISRTLERQDWAKLPEAVQVLYAEKNGKYHLDADDAEELANALARTKDEARQLKAKLDAAGDVDAEEYRRLKDESIKAQRQRDLDEKNFEKVLGEERAKLEGEVKKRDDLNAKLRGQLEEALVDGELTRAISGFPGASHALLIPAAKQRVKLKEVGGKIRAVILDDKGEPRLKDGAKTPEDVMGPAELIAEMRNSAEFAGAFPGSHNKVRDSRVLDLPPSPTAQNEKDQVNRLITQIEAGVKLS